MEEQTIIETQNLRKYIRKLEIDVFGIADTWTIIFRASTYLGLLLLIR